MTQANSAGNSPLVKVQNLRKEFKEGVSARTVIHDANINFYEGEFIVLLGQSGSGKSTLLTQAVLGTVNG